LLQQFPRDLFAATLPESSSIFFPSHIGAVDSDHVISIFARSIQMQSDNTAEVRVNASRLMRA
jgi:hypothetical protein